MSDGKHVPGGVEHARDFFVNKPLIACVAATGLVAKVDGFLKYGSIGEAGGKQHVITVPLLVNNAPLLSSQDRIQSQEAWTGLAVAGLWICRGFPFPASCGILGLNSITT